jgi:hypothetical protein
MKKRKYQTEPTEVLISPFLQLILERLKRAIHALLPQQLNQCPKALVEQNL